MATHNGLSALKTFPDLQGDASLCVTVQDFTSTAAGIELPAQNTEFDEVEPLGDAECGALCEQTDLSAPDLVDLINAWPSLPSYIKAGIFAMIRGKN